MNISELADVCLENVLIHLSDHDLHSCKLVSRCWHSVTREAVKRQNREFRRSLLAHSLISHTIAAKRNEITPRYSHSSCVFDDRLFVFGGSTKERNLFNDLWIFCLSQRKWIRPQTIGKYPSPKARASLIVHDQKLVLFGGQSVHRHAFGRESWKLFSEVHEYDVRHKSWSLVQAVNPGPSLSSHAAAVAAEQMVVFGGIFLSENRSLSVTGDLWLFDMKSHTWLKVETLSPGPSPRCGHSLVPLDEEHFLLLGGCNGQNVLLNDVWLLQFSGLTAKWKTISVRQSDSSAPQPKLHMNPVSKLTDDLLIVLNFRQVIGPDRQTRGDSDAKPESNDTDSMTRDAVSFYFLDISTVKTHGFVRWIKSENRSIRGPENVMLYSMHLTRNEIILFGGMSVRDSSLPGDDFPHVSNKLHIICSRRQVT